MTRKLLCLTVSCLAALLFAPVATATPQAAAVRLVPEPSSVVTLPGQVFTLKSTAHIVAPAGAAATGQYLAGLLRPATGFRLPVTTISLPGDIGLPGDIRLTLGGPSSLGSEGYRLTVTPVGVEVSANASAGLFYGVQTLRQLLPAKVEAKTVQSGPWTVAGVTVRDTPRYAWRGAMLDVARHFFPVPQVEQYIDLMSLYKMNTLHLHLSDNDGWRIDIKSWPRLARYGGSTDASRGPGGFYTQDDYSEIVRYAASRHVTIVPEIDTPGHVTAALASYAPLNCDGVAPPLLNPGWSSLCVPLEITYKWLDDVIGELAAITPGDYIDIGGDEAVNTSAADYKHFVNRLQAIVTAHGKKLMGWHQVEAGDLAGSALADYWGTAGSTDDEALAKVAQARGNKLVLSPADKVYLDMKYDANTPIGQDWAGYSSVQDSYDWDPATFVPGVADDVAGVEAPLWTDVFPTWDDVQFMAFPRLPGVAEIGWSAQRTHSWDAYRTRLAAQGPRWDVMGVKYFRSPDVPW
ncbi:beta-N-acetylhexosaminidase [Kutzneria sp. NPDC051319]|uniref:beta-N-acetylhexosaminidase n=1 Tax=Kutzneria sp. NPDC051319 TaxID=3155047 RepID=UPI00342FF6ED